MDGNVFRSQEVAVFWDAIGSRLDEFVQLAASIDQDGLLHMPG